MASNFIHKLMQAEIPPPESAWDKIAAELQKSETNSFVHKMRNASIEPPVGAWTKLLASLDGLKPERTGILTTSWFKWSAAAVMIGLIIVTAVLLFKFNATNNRAAKNEQPTQQSTPGAQSKDAESAPVKENNSVSSSSVSTNIDQASGKTGRPVQRKKKYDAPVKYALVESSGMRDAVSENDPQIINNAPVTSANYIPAPDHYMVTAPNGERVRISAKFSDAVTSLFGGDNVDYLWKSRFDSWKTKLISNPSFMPAAGNFLDIAELKDLLKEQ
jgi:hypothetical protein